MNVKFARRAALATGVAALSAVLIGTPAMADPTPSGTFRELVGVGSDTTQDVLNGLGNVIVDPNNSPSHFLIGSYDAVDPSTGLPGGTIVTRSGHAAVPRPNGSSAGITALANDIASGANNFDFARSSSGPSDPTGTTGTWIPFALDGVTAAKSATSTLPANVSLVDVKHAYNCQDASGNALPAGTFPTIAGVTIHPLVPQPGSGTRKFWASTLGFNATTLPGCVSDHAKDGSAVEEHDGSALQRSVAVDGSEDIMPFSIAQYIAQSNSATTGVLDRRHGAVLFTIDGVSPVTGTGTLNTSFPVKREVYNVFSTPRLTETDIKLAFVGSTSKVCTNTAVIQKFGFGTVADCGVTTIHGTLA